MHKESHRLRGLTPFLIVSFLAVGCGGGISSKLLGNYDTKPDGKAETQGAPLGEEEEALPDKRTVLVHLFEWKWTDIARECEKVLGPSGYKGVQVSPPAEHRQLSSHPWWQRYQPVSYRLESRSGSRAEFIDMVNRCKAVGVGIYVDAVINHMTGGGGGDARRDLGIAGSSYQKYDYPGLYSRQDFHSCGATPDNTIQNYQDRYQVQACELVSLSDLKTETEHVRSTIAAYLNDLLDIGVAGFRVDAAKHMPAADLENIYSRLKKPAEIFQEVIDLGFEAVSSKEYTRFGRVTEFRYSAGLGEKFSNGRIADLLNFGAPWGFVDSANAFVFTDNHDNQRGHGAGGNVLTHKNPELYELGNVFMLAWPYGLPKIMSSYKFSNGDQGPPSDSQGRTRSVYAKGEQDDCFKEWVCEHRWSAIRSMVTFRNVTDGQDVGNVFTNGSDQIAFSRGNKGFVAINRAPEKGMRLKRLLQTGLAPGQYCDIVKGERSADRTSCSGMTVTVNKGGLAEIDLEGMSALAIHPLSRLKTSLQEDSEISAENLTALTFEVTALTNWGENLYIVGDAQELGNWNPAKAVKLNPWKYPKWEVTVKVPKDQVLSFKFIKILPGGQVIWENMRANRTLTTGPEATLSATGFTFDK